MNCPHSFKSDERCLYCLDDAGRITFTVDPTKHKHERGRILMVVSDEKTPPYTLRISYGKVTLRLQGV